MKEVNYLVPAGHTFRLSDELFYVNLQDLEKFKEIGQLSFVFLKAVQSVMHIVANPNLRLSKSLKLFKDFTLQGLPDTYRRISGFYPQKNTVVTRIDLMVTSGGNWQIAEIDPMNKHGLGFAIACRNESGHGVRERLSSLLLPYVGLFTKVCLILSEKDEFFENEQRYFGKWLSERTGKEVKVIHERDPALEGIISDRSWIFFDCPIVADISMRKMLTKLFVGEPKRFMNPPYHWMSNKVLMSFLHEKEVRKVLLPFMTEEQLAQLCLYVPETYLGDPAPSLNVPDPGSYVVKRTLSSGAKGVFFDRRLVTGDTFIYQKYVDQKAFILDGTQKHIRMAVHYVGAQLAELTVTATSNLPVHGNSNAVNYHVGLVQS